MKVLLAVLVVGVGSLLFRLVPLLGADRLPDRMTRVAGWAGLSVLAAMTVRAALEHRDPAVPGAPLLAVCSIGVGLLLAFRGHSPLVAVAVGASSYLAVSAALTALS